MAFEHVSVLLHEVVDGLQPHSGGRYLDGTVGGGGHAEALLEAIGPHGELLGLDRDAAALAASALRLARFGSRVTLRQASFADAATVLADVGWQHVAGVVLDLGVSSHQFDSNERGFSFRSDARLDMRMDQRQSLNAAQIVQTYAAAQLERVLREYGEEPRARAIAAAIVAERGPGRLETTKQLADLVARIKRVGARDHHPATQTFQALRLEVNSELQQLERFLESGYDLLAHRGRMAIVSFHSLEDRKVKNAFRRWSRDCLCPPRALRCQCGWSRKAMLVTKKPMVATAEEVRANPRARSAKLRIVERV